ncbi:hypothetical protein [Lactiplantibacillus herbarum]|uniref:hypothetical protein n=1 Tax=Lactiplantibacillus herbarum TaxID=1670446 RepID=UPI00064EFC13|nr:hypothetical protein [Lactiplantibacillus herbarum]
MKVGQRLLFIIVAGVSLLLSGCGRRAVTGTAPKTEPTTFVRSTTLHTATDQRNQQQLANFIKTKMATSQGIYTNYVDTTKRQTAAATGHEMLSESAGMWLTYLAQHHQYKAFRTFYQATVKTFGDNGQFSYRYDPRTKKKFAVNATLDDLRIIRALNLYDALTKTKHYQQTAANHFAALSQGAIKNGQLTDFYDVQTKQAATTLSLAYVDLKALHYYENQTTKQKQAYQQQLKVIQNGYLGDVFPLYAASYNRDTKAYSAKNLNTSEALEVLLHLAEVGKLKAASLSWLQQQVANKDLANSYSTAGSVVDSGSSVANYALAAMIFSLEKDQAHYRQAMQLVWAGQVVQKTSAIYGGIGDAKTLQSYSYSNLTALNAADF